EIGLFGFLIILLPCYKLCKKIIVQKKYFALFLLLTLFILGSFDHFFVTLQQGQLLLLLVVSFCIGSLDKN
ncbi:MAG: hypothetical protein KGJ07_09970, partial [Patescibacteria group bacterium]|nr:hypothetical protein [Patescibacteria group bacterium]